MTWNTVSIEPGSERALALAAEDLAVMHYTGRSITKGYGRDKTSTYRSGIQTKLGDIEQGQWQALMRDIIRRNGELKLLDALIAWELEHTPWVHTREEAEQRALESFTSRSFDNPKWSDYEAFNRKHRPEVLTNQSILTLDHGYDEVPSFNDITALYDDSFFADHTLILAYVTAPSGSFRYAIQDISYGGSAFCLDVVQTNDPETHTDDMAGWFVIAEVLDSDIADYILFDAQLVERE